MLRTSLARSRRPTARPGMRGPVCATLVPIAEPVDQEGAHVSTSPRSILRRAAVSTGAFALALAAAACTGGEPEQSEPTSAEQPAPEDASTPASGDESGEENDEVAGPFSEDELELASARLLEALELLEDRDWEGTCAMVLDPSTGTAPEGERLSECVERVEPAVSAYVDGLEPGAFEAIEPSMVQAVDEGDGSVSLSIMDQAVAVPMVPGEDDRWYFAIPF